MKHNSISTVVALVLGVASCGFAQQPKEMSHSGNWAGKTGSLTIHAPFRAGDTVLPAGNYEVRRVSQPDRTFVEFTRVIEIPNPAYNFRRPPQATLIYAREKVAEVSCTRTPLPAKAKKTEAEISNQSASLTRLEIKGDNEAQLF